GRAAAQDGEGAAPSRAARQRPAERVATRERRPRAFRPSRPAARLLDPDRQPPALGRAGERRSLPARARERRPLNADAVVRRLGLRPHPEGGYYGESFRSPFRLTLPDGRVRSASTA